MITPSTIVLRGYAATFGQTAHLGNGELEQFAPGAFDAMLERPGLIDLRWDSHSDGATRLASLSGGSLSFFADEYGLGFQAKLSMRDVRNWSRLRAMTQSVKPMALVSVGGLKIKTSHREVLQVGTADVVTSASIDHLTICDDAAYAGTAVWPTHIPLDDAPSKIRQLDARWIAGRDEWERKLTARRKVEASLRPIGRTIGGGVVMVAPNGRLFHKSASGRVAW